MTTITAGRTDHTAGVVTSTLAITQRTLRKFLRTPQLVVVGTIQGAMFLLIFRYVFGGAIGGLGGVSYVDFVVPGFITTGVLFGGMSAAAGMAEDLQQGFLDRLKSLPIARFSVLAGRSLADTTMLGWSLIVSTIIGFAVGFRIHAAVLSSLEGVLLCVLFGFAFEWIFILLGLVGKTPQAAQGLSLMVFPFTFISSAYVPVASMPNWLRGFADNQPITVMVNAVRALTQGPEMERLLGHPASYFVGRSLLWSVLLVVIFAPLAVAKFRRS